jgi:hypothetical protein
MAIVSGTKLARDGSHKRDDLTPLWHDTSYRENATLSVAQQAICRAHCPH